MRDLLPTTSLLACALLLAGCGPADQTAEQRADLFTVQRGQLPIRVTEQAELKPLQSTRIKNEMEGQSTIIYLIEEGKFVEKGDRLVELDASDLIERKSQQEITLGRAEAARTSADKELEIRTKEFEAEKLGGENTVRIAEIDLEKFLGKQMENGDRDMGEQEQQLIEAQANIQLAEQEVTLAKNKLEWSLKLAGKGFITKDELERDQLDFQRQQKNLRVARNQLDILVTFTHQKELIRLQQGIREAHTDLEGIIARGKARLVQAEADLVSKEKEYELALERFHNLEQQIRSAVILAPTPGLVVYASENSGRGNSEFIEEGATVRERQTLIELPDVSRMIAELKIHEASIDKITPGQRALIEVDTYPDRAFEGVVRRVSPVADSGSRWSNNTLKVYKTQVELTGDSADLKPGMSASVTIIVALLEDVVFVPLQAIQRQGAVPYVWCDSPQGPRAAQVELGMNDFQFVEIRSGLTEGDLIYLTPPPEILEPQFEQPAKPDMTPSVDALAAAGPGAIPADANTSHSESGNGRPRAEAEGGGRGNMAAATKKLQEILERKYPDLAETVKGDRSAWFTNEELKQVLEDDDELRAARDEMMQMFSGRGQRGSRGEADGGEDKNGRDS